MNRKAVGTVFLVLLSLYCEVTGFGYRRISPLSIYSVTFPEKAINISPEEVYRQFFLLKTPTRFGEQSEEGLESDFE